MAGKWRSRRNIANRDDIDAGALRQRRDLYALAIGLFIYNIAGGYVSDQATFASLLPIRLKYPIVLLAAAWAGFFYFWFRFWLISKARPIADYKEDAEWQAGHSETGRTLAAEYVDPTATPDQHKQSTEELAARLIVWNGPIPTLHYKKGKPRIGVSRMLKEKPSPGAHVHLANFGQDVDVPDSKLYLFRRARFIGYWRAIYRERTFSDYTMPHIFACLTVLSGIFHLIVHSCTAGSQ